MTDLFTLADYLALRQARLSLIADRERARFAHRKRAKIERELRDVTSRMLRMENEPSDTGYEGIAVEEMVGSGEGALHRSYFGKNSRQNSGLK